MTGTGVSENILPSDLFQVMVETTSTAHFIISAGRVLYVNPAFETLTGYSTEELGEMGVVQVFSENPEAAHHLKAVLGGQSPRSGFETEITTKASEKRWVAVTFTRMGDLPTPAFLGTVSDISDYKRREEALRQSELRYKTVFEMAPDIIYIYDAEGPVIDQNEAAFWMFGLSREEAVHKTGIMTQLAEEDKAGFAQIREHTFKHGEWRGEMRVKRDLAQSQEFFIMDSHVKVADIGGQKVVIAIARDITERKNMEEQIRQALREKETLLREIHHRVKNNMQIISTLLQLQLRNAADEPTRAMFRESQNRILSMAMIHEKLYLSEGLHRIDLKDYIIDLAREVLISFGEMSAGVTLKTEVEEIALGLDTAIPCGLIIIELISNALKYAFPGHCREAEIFIGLRAEEQGWFGLTVSDNGVGLPAHINILALPSLGLRLVSDLARYQLGGEMNLSRQKGTKVYVRFQEKDRHSRADDYR
jgi:PAS domain S-box-containing protein